MSTPPFIVELRELVGQRLLWLPVAVAVVIDDEDRVLLQRRADTGAWAVPGGIVDPGEHPADAAVRECFEETGVVVVPDALTSVTVSDVIVYPNGDPCQFLESAFRCTAVDGTARVNDGESLEVAWHRLDALPDLDETNRRWIADAQAGSTAVFTFSGLPAVLGDAR